MSNIEPLEIENTEAIVKEEAASIILEARRLIVNDEGSLEAANDFVARIKAIRTKADEYYNPTIRATDEAHKAALAMKRVVTDPLDEAEKLARGKARSYLTVLEQKRLEEERKARAEEARIRELERQAQAKGEPVPIYAPPPAPPKRVTTEGMRKRWKADVLDESAVPREFLMVDKKKIDEYAGEMKEKAQGGADPEGKWVRFYFVVDSVVKS